MTLGRGGPTVAKAFLQKALGGSSIPSSCQQEIDRGTGGIHSAVQVGPFALHANIGLIDAPGALGRFESSPAALIQFRRYRWTQRQMLVWSAVRPRSVRSSSTLR